MGGSLTVGRIIRDNRLSPCEQVVAIAGEYPDGSPWRFSQKEAIEAIKSNAHTFYVRRGARRLRLSIGHNALCYEYLTTECDHDLPLTLPEAGRDVHP